MTLNPITRILAGRTAKMVIGILVIVEAVFISESFTTLLEITIKFGGDAWSLATLLALKMPQIIDFGLPIAIVIGFYFAITSARDNSELIVCAAAGISWKRLPVFALQIGGLGMVVSLLVSGYGLPMASYAKRIAIAQMYSAQITRQLLDPSPKITLREIGDNTLITLPGGSENGELRDNLFVYHPSVAGKLHVSLAEDWTVTRTNKSGQEGVFSANLRQFTDYSLQSRDQQLSTARVNQFSLEFKLSDLLREVDRKRRDDEVFLVGLAGLFSTSEPTDARGILGEKIARALLCPAAALLALLGAALSQFRFARLTALPFALAGVLTLDILGREILSNAAVAGVWPLSLAIAGVLAIFLLPTALVLAFTGEKVIFPLKDSTG